MPYKCLGCLRVVEQMGQVNVNTFYLKQGEPAVGNPTTEKRFICPICRRLDEGLHETTDACSPIPHCPHCRKIVHKLDAVRVVDLGGSVFLPKKGLCSVSVPHDLAEDEELTNDLTKWKITCPYCFTKISDPDMCFDYAV